MSAALPGTAEAAARPAVPTEIEFGSSEGASERRRLAARDLRDGLALWRLGATLGWLDIKLRYRGSVLGPFWLTLSTAVFVGALGGIFAPLFHLNLHDYLPFLTLSIVLWNALNTHVSDACMSFLQAETMVRSMRMPFFMHCLRVVVRTVLTLLHNVVVIAIVFAIFGVWPGVTALIALPGLALWLIDAFAACLLLGVFCARFRDIPPIVASIMQIAYFVTPIVWKPEQLGAHGWWLPLNPFYGIVEVVRGPLLGQVPSLAAWGGAVAMSGVLCVASWLLFVRVRGRLAFWV